MEEKDLIEEIRQASSNQLQTSLFGSKNTNMLEQACVKFLKFMGYRVTSPVNFKYNIKSTDDLVKFFYTMLDSKHPEYTMSYRNTGRDRKLAAEFVKNRMLTTGNSKNIALNECGQIIATVFEREEDFKFNTPIHFGMFGQAKFSWVSQRALEVMNLGVEEEKRDANLKDLERIEREQQKEYELGFTDLDSILEHIEEDEHAKKERTN